MPRDLRICFIGDSFVNGTLDEVYQGWPGRLCRQARSDGLDVTLYNLGIRRDTSQDILGRWREEAARRLPDGIDGRLVFSFGVNDCVEENGRPRIAFRETMMNAERILHDASAWKPTLVVAPPPIALLDQAQITERISAVSQGILTICQSRGIPFIDLFSLLRDEAGWYAEMQAGDGVHPTSGGYERLAKAIQTCTPWAHWMTSPPAT